MTRRDQLPIGVSLSADVEYREGRPRPYKARIRWVDPVAGRRRSLSESAVDADAAEAWIAVMRDAARAGLDLDMAIKSLASYGEAIMPLAIRGLELKTLDPYMAGWYKRVIPTLATVPPDAGYHDARLRFLPGRPRRHAPAPVLLLRHRGQLPAGTHPRHDRQWARRTGAERTFATLKDPATTSISRGWCPLMGLTLLYLRLACLDPLTLTRRQTDPPSPHRRQL